LAAYQQSLVLNPGNARLAAFVKEFKPVDTASDPDAPPAGVTTPTVTKDGRTVVTEADLTAQINGDKPKPQPTAVATPDLRLPLDKDLWIRGYVGYDYSALGDLITGIQMINSAAAAASLTGNNVQSVSNAGFLAGIEFGLKLDPGNAVCLEIENVASPTQSFSNGVTDSISDSNAIYQPSFSPDLMSITLNYQILIPGAKGSRTYLQIGAGLYQTVIGYTAWDPSTIFLANAAVNNPNETGTFSASTFGFDFGVGQVFAVGKDFGFEFNLKGRVATFNQVTAPDINAGGTPTGLGSWGMAINQGNGEIAVAPTSAIGSSGQTYRYAVIDYTGFDGNLSFDYYF